VVQLESSVHNLRLDLGEVFPLVALRMQDAVVKVQASNREQMLFMMVRQKI
jgi:hypothetical protein